MTKVDIIDSTRNIVVVSVKKHNGIFIIPDGTKIYDSGNMDVNGHTSDIEYLIDRGVITDEGAYKGDLACHNGIEELFRRVIIDNDYSKYNVKYTEIEDDVQIIPVEHSDKANKSIEQENGEQKQKEIDSAMNGLNNILKEASMDQLISAIVHKMSDNQKTVKLDPDDMAQIERVVSQGREISIPDKEINKIKEMFNKQPKEDEQEYQWTKQSVTFEDREIIGYSDILDKINELLETNKHALLIEGVPGTGKTLILNKYLEHVKNSDASNILFVSFHQNYSYNEFIGGYTADIEGGFSYKDGVFTRFCQKADSNRDQKYYCFIDEISRGNVEAIFGEIMTALTFRDRIITLGCGRQFMIPSNVYIVASRNITDKSTKDMDIATLQRFERLLIEPQWTDEYIDSILRNKEDADCRELLNMLCEAMKNINEEIRKDSDLGSHYQIGTRALDLSQISFENIKSKIRSDLIPSIEENIKGSFGIKDKVDRYLKDLKDLKDLG